MVGLAGFRPDESERPVDIAGPGKGDQQGFVAVVAGFAHDQELAGRIGAHGRSFNAHFYATRSSIGD